MLKTKLIATMLLTAAVLFAQVGNVAAAPVTQVTTPITGTIQSIIPETDSSGVTTILVTLLDDQGATQTVRLSVDTAVGLGLVSLDPITGELLVVAVAGDPVEIDPATVIPDVSSGDEEAVHPIAALLSAFFGEDGSVIDSYHEDGFGFGVIAQALWMSQNLNGDASLASEILEAKESGDFSAFFPEGTENIPTNWGQFKKAVLEKKNNLGVIVSGHAEPEELTAQQEPGNGNGHGHGNGNGNGHGNNKNKGNGKDK